MQHRVLRISRSVGLSFRILHLGSVNEHRVRRRHLRHGLLEVVSANAEARRPPSYMSLVSFS